MSAYAGPDRRRDHRFKLSREVHYRPMGRRIKDRSFRRAVSSDVSRRGLRLLAAEPLERGSQVEVFVLARDGNPKVSGMVEVVRCVPQPLTTEYYNEYYNPKALLEYDVGLSSSGSALFSRVTDIT